MEHTSSTIKNTSSDKRIKYLKPSFVQIQLESAILASSNETINEIEITDDPENGSSDSRTKEYNP